MKASVGLLGILASVIVVSLVCVESVVALTLGFDPKKDNTLYESTTGHVSNGAGECFFAGRTQTGLIRRGVVAFDVSRSIPPGTVLDSVVVILHVSRTLSGPVPVGLHRLLADWGEGSSDAALEEGGGDLSTPSDATWIHRFFDTQIWASAGGDFQATPSAVADVGGIGFYSWSSPALLADVKQWVNDPATNFGWLVRGDEDAVATSKRFNTRESPDASMHPRLLVVFPEPTDAAAASTLTLRLHPSRPNPFRLGTTIAYELSRAGQVELRIHDARGRLLRTLVTEPRGPGRHVLFWEGRDNLGHDLGSGSYFLVLRAEGNRKVERLVLVR